MKTVVFQGDSITDFNRSRDNSWSESGDLGFGYANLAVSRWRFDNPGKEVKFVNTGISGNRVTDLYARWKADTLNYNPSVISILIGVNDVWHEFSHQNGVETPRFKQIYELMLKWTKEVLPEVKLVLMEPFALSSSIVTPEFRANVEEHAAAVKEVAAEFGAIFVPLQAKFDAGVKLAPESFWLYDGVHPAPAGHQLIAEEWLKVVSPLLAD